MDGPIKSLLSVCHSVQHFAQERVISSFDNLPDR